MKASIFIGVVALVFTLGAYLLGHEAGYAEGYRVGYETGEMVGCRDGCAAVKENK